MFFSLLLLPPPFEVCGNQQVKKLSPNFRQARRNVNPLQIDKRRSPLPKKKLFDPEEIRTLDLERMRLTH